MQDGIIKGNGASRFIKGVPGFLSQYPTYEDFASALVAGTLTIDLNGINPAGWTQQGTELNKANLLSDAAVSALGLSGNQTPSTAFAAIPTAAMLQRVINKQSARTPASSDLVSSNNGKISIANLLSYVKGQSIATGSYTGTGTYGQSNPCSLTFNFQPKIVVVTADSTTADFGVFIRYCSMMGAASSVSRFNSVSWGTTSVSWYGQYGEHYQLNESGIYYYWTAIG